MGKMTIEGNDDKIKRLRKELKYRLRKDGLTLKGEEVVDEVIEDEELDLEEEIVEEKGTDTTEKKTTEEETTKSFLGIKRTKKK